MSAPTRVLAFVGSRCGVPSPCPCDDGAWNGYEVGDEEPCVLCFDPSCVARVIDWQVEGHALVQRLVDSLAVALLRLDLAERVAEDARCLVGQTHAPNPQDPKMRYVKPKSGVQFSAAVRSAEEHLVELDALFDLLDKIQKLLSSKSPA